MVAHIQARLSFSFWSNILPWSCGDHGRLFQPSPLWQMKPTKHDIFLIAMSRNDVNNMHGRRDKQIFTGVI
jgi:hypothetical protein